VIPDTLDDYVDEDHPVRVIDAFVDTLDMKALDFSKAETQVTRSGLSGFAIETPLGGLNHPQDEHL
jgi:hypothetical protein